MSTGLLRDDFVALSDHFRAHGFPPLHPFALLWPRLSGDDQQKLAASIRKNGVRDTIICFDGQIVDGVARCLGAIEAGISWEDLPKESFEGHEDELLELVLDRNLNRRHLNESQRAMVAARLATMRQGARTDLAQICARSQKEAAGRLNVSRSLVQQAGKIQNRGVPELQAAVEGGNLPVSLAVKAIRLSSDKQREVVSVAIAQAKPRKAFQAALRNAEIQSRHRQITAGARRYDLGHRRYAIGLVDIPWEGRVSWAGDPFPRLSIDEVCQFRLDDGRLIREVMADDAILFLWILDRLLLDPQQPLQRILQAWGDFRHQHLKIWPKLAMSTGHYARYQHETCLVCTRGSFAPPEEPLRPSTLIVGPSLADGTGFQIAPTHDNRHSSKPDRLYEIIERAYPQYFGPETVESPLALELFARNYRPRWDGQGFEYPGRPARDDDQPNETRTGKDHGGYDARADES